ncbi:unnamed protein product [Ceratitis capitata]|uniref:(Mediterranean fruit fly) hypothetical protein n=1 Tax=Ceratitis capitata TaxID=7213 RepID=A0A811V4Z7_CERCA|nr:unnamed protein product [Ceratitis capitata]
MKTPAKDSKYSVNLKIFKLHNYSSAPKILAYKQQQRQQVNNATGDDKEKEEQEQYYDIELPDKRKHLDSNNDAADNNTIDNRSKHWADALDRISTQGLAQECSSKNNNSSSSGSSLRRLDGSELDEFMSRIAYMTRVSLVISINRKIKVIHFIDGC